jgi:glutathione S-transferase
MMVMYSGTPLMNKAYDAKPNGSGGWDTSDWFSVKPELKAKNPFMNLPYVIDGENIVSQTNACFTHLGRKLGMMGKDEAELCACEQLLCELMDLRNKIVGYAYSPKGTDSAESAAFLESVKGILEKLELFLNMNIARRNPPSFFVGNGATAPDFHAWELFDQLDLYAARHSIPSPVASFPSLTAFHREFAALPNNSRYFASKLSKLPMNNLMASIGSLRTVNSLPMVMK